MYLSIEALLHLYHLSTPGLFRGDGCDPRPCGSNGKDGKQLFNPWTKDWKILWVVSTQISQEYRISEANQFFLAWCIEGMKELSVVWNPECYREKSALSTQSLPPSYPASTCPLTSDKERQPLVQYTWEEWWFSIWWDFGPGSALLVLNGKKIAFGALYFLNKGIKNWCLLGHWQVVGRKVQCGFSGSDYWWLTSLYTFCIWMPRWGLHEYDLCSKIRGPPPIAPKMADFKHP